eukprot:m.36628 g.36628  ORF g.36628 m.36628 type:complete len:350 (-) comp6689_c1_seq1:4244-5293(-)
MERPMQQGSDVNEEGNEAHEPSLSLQGDALEAMKEFERAHNIQEEDLIYCYDEDEYKLSIAGEQWKSDPKYFKHTKISALALLKMVMHANSGGNLEIMGMLQGKVEGDTIIIMDVFALPVKGTETRVNAGDQEYAFMFEYVGMMKDCGRHENVIGWYHSHPGYGCWLSGIDVNTQLSNQQLQDPWLAIVVDPVRTAASSRVEIGAFRCFPKGHLIQNAGDNDGYQSIPLDKIEDFGVHANAYYSLEVSFFKSSLQNLMLESLWSKYWVNTLSSSSMANGDEYESKQICDISQKVKKHTDPSRGMVRIRYVLPSTKGEDPFQKIARDGTTAAVEMASKVMKEKMKTKLFS